ncbi:hypothetical protein HN615_07150 [Candidatus Woesearchaeota archaeon]|nr:hypothetical protein [Candidatus Woesearchaeota archaeon]
MGRKKIHQTIEEQRAANNKARKRYYEKNKEKIRAARMEKYYESTRTESKG